MPEDRRLLFRQGDSDDQAPIGGALYRHPSFRGRWRVETAGPKWVKLRALEVIGLNGFWATYRERREDWPNEWMRDAN